MLSVLRSRLAIKKKEMVLQFDYKNLAPLFVDEEMRICIRRRPDNSQKFDVWIEGPEGGYAVKATAETGFELKKKAGEDASLGSLKAIRSEPEFSDLKPRANSTELEEYSSEDVTNIRRCLSIDSDLMRTYYRGPFRRIEVAPPPHTPKDDKQQYSDLLAVIQKSGPTVEKRKAEDTDDIAPSNQRPPDV